MFAERQLDRTVLGYNRRMEMVCTSRSRCGGGWAAVQRVFAPHHVRVAHLLTRGALATAIFAASCLGCSDAEEARTLVFVGAFELDRKPLSRARIRFRDAQGKVLGEGVLHHGNGFRFESDTLREEGDWGKRVRAVDLDADTCSSRGDRVEREQHSLRVATGGHPSWRSKKLTYFDLRATLVCYPPLTEARRLRWEPQLRHGEVRSRVRAAIELGWLQAPALAPDSLKEAMHNAAAIAIGIEHSPKASALPALIVALDDERESVRVAAAWLLAKLGRNEHGIAVAAVPALQSRAEDPSELVRLVAEYAIDHITPR